MPSFPATSVLDPLAPSSARRVCLRDALVSMAGLLLIQGVAGTAAADVIEFTGGTRPFGAPFGAPYYQEDGFRLTPGNAYQITRSPSSVFPFNGGGHVSFRLSDGPALLTNVAAEPFRLLSVDLAEYSNYGPLTRHPVTVTATGLTRSGRPRVTSFTVDGIIDGGGPLDDFQTFVFGADWTDLASVEFSVEPGFGYSLDNIAFEIVPEPSAALLIGLGLGALAYRPTTPPATAEHPRTNRKSIRDATIRRSD